MVGDARSVQSDGQEHRLHDRATRKYAMSGNRDLYGPVENEADMRRVFKEIRGDVERADSRLGLTELYRRAGYLITLTYSPAWGEKFGDEAERLRQVAEDEFHITAQRINQRADGIGTDANYKESWGSA
jgi:hypothetical protein